MSQLENVLELVSYGILWISLFVIVFFEFCSLFICRKTNSSLFRFFGASLFFQLVAPVILIILAINLPPPPSDEGLQYGIFAFFLFFIFPVPAILSIISSTVIMWRMKIIQSLVKNKFKFKDMT